MHSRSLKMAAPLRIQIHIGKKYADFNFDGHSDYLAYPPERL